LFEDKKSGEGLLTKTLRIFSESSDQAVARTQIMQISRGVHESQAATDAVTSFPNRK